jgi:alpha-beta hydrolase superfamily lysophospholipase
MARTSTSQHVRSADGTEIAFEFRGEGPALILIDPALQYRDFTRLSGLVEPLSSEFTVFTYDRRGRGESTDAGTGTVQAEVDDIAALIGHAGGSAAVLGFSSGAVLSMEAVLAGLPITGLALFEPPFVVTADRPPVAPDYRERLLRALAEGRPGDAVAQFLTETAVMPAEQVAAMRAEPFWAGLEQVAPTLPHDAAIMGQTMSGDPATLRRYAAVAVPTLVIYSEGSPAWLAAGATAIAGILPNASHRGLPGEFHDVSPEVLAPVLSDWLPTLKH